MGLCGNFSKIRPKINTICHKVAQWQNARLNKQAGFDVERDKIQSLDTNIVNMTAESLNFSLTKFVEEVCQVCKEDGERYPHWNAEFTVCRSVLYICT